ncbi:dicarboxylate/amino acid:cation symporter [Chlamydiifrater phoenicopteri]|uniref:dicarboxylate/amino acid:cation symporter n=1 Tax=Chlamydiifrater phoenicopteri TaxID=2681469 RepID=UPI001BD096E3|nr:dicarboxylate/amino acid:cation symporter [Chlamydiifrater phoenicopteri]
MNRNSLKQMIVLLIAFFVGICLGMCNSPQVIFLAEAVSNLFIKTLKLIGVPLVFLSIISTLSSFRQIRTVLILGKKVAKYTLLTTVIAAAVGLALYILIIRPQGQMLAGKIFDGSEALSASGYLAIFANAFPDNFIKPLLEGNVIAVFVLASLLGIASLFIAETEQDFVHRLSTALFSLLLKVAKGAVSLLPLVVTAFSVLFVKDMKLEKSISGLALYLTCIVAANLIQGIIVLPFLLKLHKISPLKVVKGVLPALVAAFFSKSSSATLPLTMELSEEKLKITPEISRFSLPLCSVINMNGCAAFILITVLFACQFNHILFTPLELAVWVGIATLAAVGNAGVPMGCFFLSSALLSSMGVSLQILGTILPFYAFLDMIETSLNVWSDCCVTAVVDKALSRQRIN